MPTQRRTLTPIAASLALASTLFLTAAAHAQNVATVNGVGIPQARMDAVLKMLAANKQPDTPENRNRIKEQLVTNEIIAQEAVKKGLSKNPEIVQQIELQRQELLISAYLQDYARANPVSDDVLRKEYERLKSSTSAKEYKVSHILVDKEDDAKDIIAQLKKGASFAKLAADKSKDPGSKTRGGDLDWGPANRYVKPFGDALGKLKKGQTTDAPVQTEYGFHVIRLNDERATKVPTFEEFKPQLQQGMQNQLIQKMIAELRSKAKVE